MAEPASTGERDDLAAAVRDLERRLALVEKHLATVAWSAGIFTPKEWSTGTPKTPRV